MTDEESRAAAYLASLATRDAAAAARAAALTGSSSARANLELNWQPLTAQGDIFDGRSEEEDPGTRSRCL